MVEFHEATEARAAFRKLAYTKFKSGTPLYLEWGPENAFKTSTSNPSIDAAQPNTGNQGHESHIISNIPGFYFGQSFSPLHSPETPVNRFFGVSNRVFAFSDQVLAFLHQEFAFLTSFQPENRICM